ncbi:MAG: Clp protease N-terminal domain-containing protein [bacterium]
MNFDRFTIEAAKRGRRRRNRPPDPGPELYPEHLLIALLKQEDGVVPALVQRVGPAAGAGREARRGAARQAPRPRIHLPWASPRPAPGPRGPSRKGADDGRPEYVLGRARRSPSTPMAPAVCSRPPASIASACSGPPNGRARQHPRAEPGSREPVRGPRRSTPAI